MPAMPSSPRVKLRTTSRRVPRARAAAAATDDPPEPTMRLSRAILVMLLLHVVAVGGFFASSVLKERDLKHSADPATALEAEDSQVPSTGGGTNQPKQIPAKTNVHVVRPGETLTLIANETGVSLEALVAANGADTVTNGLHTGQELKLPDHSPDPGALSSGSTDNASSIVEGHAKSGSGMPLANGAASAKVAHPPADGGKIYVVGKGENAYTIAQKNKVSYEALLKLNQIADPKKIQPGQKLRLPLATSKLKSK